MRAFVSMVPLIFIRLFSNRTRVDTHYKMDHPKRGKAIIIYNTEFDEFDPLYFLDKDEENFRRVFEKLGFELNSTRGRMSTVRATSTGMEHSLHPLRIELCSMPH